MSRHVVSLVYSRKAGSLLRKSVLAYMADVANHDGTGVWSSKQRIADEIEASRRGVIDCIKGLVKDGILAESGKRKCANGYTIEYSIDLDMVSALPLMPHNQEEGCKSALVNDVHPTREPDAPDPCTQFTQTVLNRPKPTTNVVDARDAQTPLKAKTKRTPKRGSRMSETWAPTQMDYAHATKAGLGPQEINHETDQFRDYHISKGTISKDWAASWRTWCRNAVKWKAQRKPSSNGHNPGAFIRGIEEAADLLDHAPLSRRSGQEFHQAGAYAASSDERGEEITIDADGHVIASEYTG